jgi:hypothetical protein
VVAILVRNEAQRLPRCLEALADPRNASNGALSRESFEVVSATAPRFG